MKKNWFVVLLIAGLSMLAVRMVGEPVVYTGLIAAYFGVLLSGMLSNRFIGAITGGATIGLGLLVRRFWQEIPTFKPKKMATWTANNEQFTAFISQYWWVLILGGIAIGFLAGLLGEALERRGRMPQQKDEDEITKPLSAAQYFTPKHIAQMSIFIAIGVVINSMRVGFLSFGGLPIVLSGYIFGPVGGFIIGGVTDLVAFLVRPSSYGFNLAFTLTSALTGAIPVLVTDALGGKKVLTFWRVLVGVVIGQFLTSVILVPLFMSLFIGEAAAKATFFRALVKQTFSAPVYAVLVLSLMQALAKSGRMRTYSSRLAPLRKKI